MSQILNQYSSIWFAALFALVAGLFIFRKNANFGDLFAFAIVLVGLVMVWRILHPTQTPLMENAQKVQQMIGKGTPVLLEFQSPY